jgi:hypothetical protein
VWVLKTAHNQMVSLYADQPSADAKRDRWNTDPFLSPGEPDPDAPYVVERWRIQDGGPLSRQPMSEPEEAWS